MRNARVIIVLAVIVILGFVPILDAQYIRIGNAGSVPNGAVVPPTILKSTLALYTDEARTHGAEGNVTIAAEVGEDGQIRSTQLLKGLGFGLDEVALESVREWVLSPATRNGVPVSVVAQIDVEFSLRTANALRMDLHMLPPTVQQRVEPQYTDEARRAGLSGAVVLQAVVHSDGAIDVIRIVRGLPLGLTDSAITAIKQWRFKPGQRDGKNVDVALNVEINFILARKN